MDPYFSKREGKLTCPEVPCKAIFKSTRMPFRLRSPRAIYDSQELFGHKVERLCHQFNPNTCVNQFLIDLLSIQVLLDLLSVQLLIDGYQFNGNDFVIKSMTLLYTRRCNFLIELS